MKKFIFIIVVVILAVAGITYINSQSKSTTFFPASKIEKANKSLQDKNDPPLTSIIAEDLEVPWSLVFLPDESILVTERPGRVRIIDKNGVLYPEPALVIPVIQKIQGEGGLHGITIHPDFEKNRFVYLYYTYENQGSKSLNRVARFVFDGKNLTDEKVIVDRIPGALFHDGGRIKFGPDKLLYITTGDAQEPSLAQDKNSLAGKILRVTPEGKAVSGNPFGNPVFSYGHRNPQGITWDDKGDLFETEHGDSATDELNRIEIGKNYGWPEIKGDGSRVGVVSPIVHSGSDTWAPGGAAFLDGSVYFVGLRGKSLYQAVLSDNSVKTRTHLSNEFGRLRDIVVGPDKMLYITTSNRDGRGFKGAGDDKIIRVNPAKL